MTAELAEIIWLNYGFLFSSQFVFASFGVNFNFVNGLGLIDIWNSVGFLFWTFRHLEGFILFLCFILNY